MTFSELKASLEAGGLDCHEYIAPPGAAEYIVLNPYRLRGMQGDDRAVMRWMRCQLDCYSQNPDAGEAGGAFEFILNTLDGYGLPYSVEDCSYDNDAAAMRMIVQCDLF